MAGVPFELAIITERPDGRLNVECYAKDQAPTMPPAELVEGATSRQDLARRMVAHQAQVRAAVG